MTHTVLTVLCNYELLPKSFSFQKFPFLLRNLANIPLSLVKLLRCLQQFDLTGYKIEFIDSHRHSKNVQKTMKKAQKHFSIINKEERRYGTSEFWSDSQLWGLSSLHNIIAVQKVIFLQHVRIDPVKRSTSKLSLIENSKISVEAYIFDTVLPFKPLLA